ncbi:MAG TPA: CPBP family intramembrane metalloprotease [Spirochaetia bacterium]|nr:CPBP family intramembrane metalloprotease [Spirochaetales bacterium]HRW24410.1 CPBP family intramembrane metalloprotease [Spirochaetia bacterium]
MDTDSARATWAEPLLVTLAVAGPGLIPYQPPAAGAVAWLAGSALQSFSQFTLLLVIIGLGRRLREYGVAKPSARDAVVAAGVFAAMLCAATVAAALVPVSAADTAPLADGAAPAALVALSAAFAIAVAYREELFYRCYLLGALTGRGAGPLAAAAVSTGLFAAGHAYQGPAGMISAAAVGSALAAARLRGARLHGLAWGHAAYDFAVLLAGFGITA